MPGNRRTLTPSAIASAALEVADSDPAALTMRRIAARLGCDPMAIYRHFANRETLLDAVADLVLAEVADPDPGEPWERQVTTTAHAIRAAALRHPGIAGHIASRPPVGEQGQRIGAALLAALTAAGMPSPAAVQVLQTLIAYLAAALAMAVRAGHRDERWHDVSKVVDRMIAGEVGNELFTVGSVEQFDFGLRLLVAGARSEVIAPQES